LEKRHPQRGQTTDHFISKAVGKSTLQLIHYLYATEPSMIPFLIVLIFDQKIPLEKKHDSGIITVTVPTTPLLSMRTEVGHFL
jgi:hypothetical protein